MWNNFFKHIDIDPANAHILDGNAEDLESECQAYEQKIAEAGGIELFVGGQTHCFLCCFVFHTWGAKCHVHMHGNLNSTCTGVRNFMQKMCCAGLSTLMC